MPILHIRDENGNFIPIPTIKGTDGKSAYELAKEGGYQGTEEEFIQILGSLGGINAAQLVDENGDYGDHLENKSNPHNVTASQTGAIPEAYYASDDLNSELQQGGGKMTICSYHSGTLNSPYKDGLTVFAHGMVITNACSDKYGTQLCMPSGDKHIYIRTLNGQGVLGWEQVVNKPDINAAQIASGTYTGTGTHGESNKNSLTFPFVPKVVFISTPSTVASGTDNATYFATATLMNGSNLGFVTQSTEDANRGYSIPLRLLWSDKTLSWYYVNTSTSSTGMTASYQLNYSGMVYNWVAIG